MKYTTAVSLIYCLIINTETKAQLTFHDYSGKTILGDSIDFSMYYGKKVMVVNTASYCTYTHQYTDLEQLYTDYHQYNFEILGFPCNDFFSQEPGSDSTILHFCENYNVTFQMMSKIATVSADTAPVYKWLQRANLNGVQNATVSWNFNKFLIDEAGHWVAHYDSPTDPQDTAITNWIMQPSVTIGINEHNQNKIEVNLISANPVNENLLLAVKNPLQKKITMDIFSVEGKLAKPLFAGIPGLNQNLSFNVNELPSGIYFLKLNSNSFQKNIRFVVTK